MGAKKKNARGGHDDGGVSRFPQGSLAPTGPNRMDMPLTADQASIRSSLSQAPASLGEMDVQLTADKRQFSASRGISQAPNNLLPENQHFTNQSMTESSRPSSAHSSNPSRLQFDVGSETGQTLSRITETRSSQSRVTAVPMGQGQAAPNFPQLQSQPDPSLRSAQSIQSVSESQRAAGFLERTQSQTQTRRPTELINRNQSHVQPLHRPGPQNPFQFQPTLTTPVYLQREVQDSSRVYPGQRPRLRVPHRQSFGTNPAFGSNLPSSGMPLNRQGPPKIYAHQAEARAQLQNPRGQAAQYVDPRQDPEWRKAQQDKAMQKARRRIARGRGFRSLVQSGNPMPSLRELQSTGGQNGYGVAPPIPPPQQQASVAQFPGLESQQDQEMAVSQLGIENMNIASQEFFVQDAWAKSQLRKIGNTCPRGCRWSRITGGYRCGQGFHWATDQLISEGKGEVITSLRVVPKGFPNQGEKLKTGSRYD
ncbi:uncharacterized protein EAE97_000802 [Botrytis byssoidea]|uniref:Uncharacterized protein n=1 Tax=Botrytis byssoidea TaxID=139641 RepID=A0A9P5IZ05_9HELO|nr:uncharacterized protein EAE97_000802 [Botrytis byssoidea]KAF7953403.1 hypothetical protein EAE97_000802 [Botrytis byssoidea]